jgi:hypothetical protein
MNIQRIALLTSFFIAPLCFAAEPPPKTLTPGDNLVIDGIPPIPMAQNFCLEEPKIRVRRRANGPADSILK